MDSQDSAELVADPEPALFYSIDSHHCADFASSGSSEQSKVERACCHRPQLDERWRSEGCLESQCRVGNFIYITT